MKAMRNVVVAFILVACSLGRADAEPGKDAPVLKWSSSDETGVYGYILYRAVDAKGPFLRVNARIIPRNPPSSETGADSAKTKSTYQFVDEGADPALTNYYYIDAIGDSGRKKRLTGVVSKAPKVAPQQDSAD
jgi:predicted secreted Zn-dependent protease